MIRLFTEHRALTVFLLPLFTASYLLLNHLFPYFDVTNELNFGLFGTYFIEDTLPKQFAGGILVFLNAVGINLIFNQHNLYEKTTYLPAFIYIVWMSFFKVMYNPDGFLLSHTALIIMLSQLFRLNQNEDGRKLAFNTAFFAGIATCLHPAMIISLPFLFIMIWIVRPFVFRESLLILAGFITPLLYAGTLILFQNGDFQQEWKLNIISLENEQIKILVTASFILLFTIISFFGIRNKLQKSSIRFRKLVRILWVVFFLSVCVGVLNFLLLQQKEYFSLVFVTLSFF